MSNLPDLIKIDDIASGKIDPEDIYAELDRLKAEINILRNDMAQFVRALAFIPDDANQQQYYATVSNRLKTVQRAIKDYCAQYNRLLPIINLSQIRLGHEVEQILSNDRRQSSNGNLLATASNNSALGDTNSTTTDLSHPISPPNTAPAPSQGPISVHPNTTSSASGSGANARTPIVLP
ncbi:hypothetical protein QFC19_002111 [Naganishia cerealis]|uniref:Uncharacterized protein n=1 Tax=Naganishia cerealis TaxID=610337 RepID=A0ACC2WE96_9TREE|nr:hypothetical protein QFC19_002111 [Naganishia cerealis]